MILMNRKKEEWMPREKNIIDDDFPPIRSVYCGSFGSKKTLSLDDVGVTYPTHCFGRAVIGVSDSIGRLHFVKKMVANADFLDAAVSYLGGLTVRISFRDKDEMEDFMISKENVWKETLVSVAPCISQEILFERIVVLKIVGIPVSVRDSVVYEKVGSLFGKVVWPSDFSWFDVDESVVFSHVLTQSSASIDKEISITWKGDGYNVWVVEEHSTWVPEFEEVDNSSNLDDMEEGEIRDGMLESLAGGIDGSDGNYGAPKIQEPLADIINDPVDLPCGSNVDVGGEDLNNVGQQDEVHVDSNVGRFSYCTPSGPVGEATLGFNVGCFEKFKSRKRTRVVFHNSPKNTSSNLFYTTPVVQEVAHSIPDLNINNEETVVVEDNPSQHVVDSVQEDVMAATRVGVVENCSEKVVQSDFFDEAQCINVEVDNTIRVGSLVGINLIIFESSVAEEIVTEVGSSVAK